MIYKMELFAKIVKIVFAANSITLDAVLSASLDSQKAFQLQVPTRLFADSGEVHLEPYHTSAIDIFAKTSILDV